MFRFSVHFLQRFFTLLFLCLLFLLAEDGWAVEQEKSVTLELIGQIGGPTQTVAVQGNYAYVGVGLKLVVLDVSEPTMPTVMGTTEPLPNVVEGVAVSDTVAYVAAGRAGMYVLNISDPANPTVVGLYDTPGYAEGVAVIGQNAYVADGPSGLRIVDISDPIHPTEIAFAYPLNYVFDVAADGQHAYLAAAGAGLLVVNISDPAHPTEIGTYDTQGYAYGIGVAENMVYIADGWEGLRVVNASDPAHPVEVGYYNTPGWAFGVDIVSGMAYMADALGGLRVVDVSDPTHPIELGCYEASGGHAGTVIVRGNTAYVADRNWGLRVVDVSDPSAPTQTGLYAPMGYVVAVAVSGNYAYVAAATYGLRVVSISDPAHPTEVGAYDAQGSAIGVAVAGNYAYVAVSFHETGTGLHVVDVSDPANPTRIGYCESVGMPRDIAVAGAIAYIANEWGLELIDISSPHIPTLAGYINLQGAEWAATTSVDVSGNLAYVAGDGGLYIVDVSNPFSPTLISNLDIPFGAFDLAVAGTRAYVTGGGSCLNIVDVSDPLDPTQLGEYCVQNFPERVIVANNIAYVAFGGGGLHGVDVTDPFSPTLAFSYDTLGYTIASAVAGNYVYVADAEGGLLILEMGGGQSKASRPMWTKAASFVGALGNFAPSQSQMFGRGNKTSLIQRSRNRIAPQGQPLQHHNRLDIESTSEIHSISGTCVVTSTADSGPGTLRECMENAITGDTITFDPAVFPPENPVIIALQESLPSISCGNLTIDASDAGVILDGSALVDGSGVYIDSDENVIKGLQILNFPFAGVNIGSGAKRNVIGGNRARGSGPTGEGNVISANGTVGVFIGDTGTMNNTVIGNLIGTDANGTSVLANGWDGVDIKNGASYNTIGSLTTAGKRNVISGNKNAGVCISSYIGKTMGNTILGNFIGTDVNGTVDLGNEWTGVIIELGSPHNVVKGNLISGSNWGGIVIADWGSSYNTVVGNLIGTDSSGMQAIGNRWVGVVAGANFNRIGGTSPGDGNLISGNPVGISLMGTGNLILGNLIGTNMSGTETISNHHHGIFGCGESSHNFVGGTTPSERNLISGNGAAGISLEGADFNFVIGNYIGTDVSGTVALPNRVSGIECHGAKYNVIQGNLIAGNEEGGVSIGYGGDFTHLRANRIGITADVTSGTSCLPNNGIGISINAISNLVGGPYSGDGNIIAYSTGSGIRIASYPYNTIRRNSIYTNAGKGIENINGGNNMLPAPLIQAVTTMSVSGTACASCVVEVFSDNEDEGRLFEGSTIAAASGLFTFTKNSALTGPQITATATDKEGNTSEFSTPAIPFARSSNGGRGGGGCFIATAVYGSVLSNEVKALKQLRDEYLLTNEFGRTFVSAYYKYSPGLADVIGKHLMLRKIVRIGLYPLLGLSKWLVGEHSSR